MKHNLLFIELEIYADRGSYVYLDFKTMNLETPSLFFARQIITQMLDSHTMPPRFFLLHSSALTMFRLFRE